MRYRVVAMCTISVHTDVEADSPAQALLLALDRPLTTIWENTDEATVLQEWVTSGELDGTPFNLEVGEADV
jgi:hypothetical protein